MGEQSLSLKVLWGNHKTFPESFVGESVRDVQQRQEQSKVLMSKKRK